MRVFTKVRIAALVLALIQAPALEADPANQRITVVAGTPVQLSTQHIKVHSLFIQMRTGGTGRGYVLRVPPGTTPSASNGAHLSAEMAPASATAPGGSYSDSDMTPAGTRKEIWLDWIYVDGSNSGDTITVSWDAYQ